MKNLTTKQFGDACEYRIMSDLMFAGFPTAKMPDGWPVYDLMAETASGSARISVKALRYGSGQIAGWWEFKPDNFDWLALVRANEVTLEIVAYIVPVEKAIEMSTSNREGTQERRPAARDLGTSRHEVTVSALQTGQCGKSIPD